MNIVISKSIHAVLLKTYFRFMNNHYLKKKGKKDKEIIK